MSFIFLQPKFLKKSDFTPINFQFVLVLRIFVFFSRLLSILVVLTRISLEKTRQIRRVVDFKSSLSTHKNFIEVYFFKFKNVLVFAQRILREMICFKQNKCKIFKNILMVIFRLVSQDCFRTLATKKFLQNFLYC